RQVDDVGEVDGVWVVEGLHGPGVRASGVRRRSTLVREHEQIRQHVQQGARGGGEPLAAAARDHDDVDVVTTEHEHELSPGQLGHWSLFQTLKPGPEPTSEASKHKLSSGMSRTL